ncbi:MAG: hypothetical protein ACI94D_000546 [Neolewinella sp.]|jgi:hypothetical protein
MSNSIATMNRAELITSHLEVLTSILKVF